MPGPPKRTAKRRTTDNDDDDDNNNNNSNTASHHASQYTGSPLLLICSLIVWHSFADRRAKERRRGAALPWLAWPGWLFCLLCCLADRSSCSFSFFLSSLRFVFPSPPPAMDWDLNILATPARPWKPAAMCTPPPSRSLADELHNHHHNQQPITPLQPARPPPLETPSRLVGFSPGLFASPDLFSLAAPDLGLASVYGDPFAASVADDSSCFGPGPLLQRPPSLPPQHDLPAAYSAIAIATSPRPPPQPAPDDPALFLSSPARRFGLSDATALSSPPPPPPPPPTRPVETRQPYHYQTEACEREKRDRLAGKLSLAKNAARRPHTTRVESAAYHPPAPAPKPGKRSVTHSGTPVRHQRQSSLSLAAAAPVLGGAGVKKTPSKGRSSPLKPTVVSRAPPMESLVLKISKDGLATTEMKLLARDSSTEIDSDSSDGEDDDEDRFTHSQNPSFAVPVATPRRPDFIRAQSTSRPPSHGSAYSSSTHSPWTASSHSRRARTSFQRDHTTPTKSAPRRSRSHSLSDSDTPHHDSRPGDAQHALMEVLKCRKRQSRPLAPGSARTVSHYSQSSALSALPSSPPSYHSRSRATGSASPTTLIDTELPTPVADRQNNPSTGTRCVCRSMNNGGHLMIQCDSCAHWLHTKCVGLDRQRLPPVYICVYCTQTPNRNGRVREPFPLSGNSSPLARKSHRGR